MSRSFFIGRQSELERLNALYNRRSPALVVVKGRRRIGKSRLIAEFASQKPEQTFWSFADLAPQDSLSAQDQRNYFAKQLAGILKLPAVTFLDWTDAFEYLSIHVKTGDVILFDEISWMSAKDPTFVPKLKAWWDKQTTHLMLVFCGSVSTWINENILNSTAFFGRINLLITLEPFTISESAEFLKKKGVKGSFYETYRLLSILGGVPWYLEQLDPTKTADQNIKELALRADGVLVTEFDKIFHDLFEKKGVTYKRILHALKEGARTLAQIREAIDFSHSGTLSALMEHLITAGFVCKQALWSFKTGKSLKQSLYRISDPYIRFYVKVIEENRTRIEKNDFQNLPLSSVPGLEAHLGLQLEYLLLQNRSLLLKSMGIFLADIVQDGPYRQSTTTQQKGCQIDYLIQTITKTLYLCEFKFSRREIGVEVMDEMKGKIAALKVPRGVSVIPVLFHLSDVSTTVATSSFFYRIIDIADFLEQSNEQP